MDMPQETDHMRAYMQSVTSSRTTMNNMLNILAQQDRNMQDIIILTNQRRRQTAHHDIVDNGMRFPGFSSFSNIVNDLPQFTHHNRRDNMNMNSRDGRSSRTFGNNRRRRQTEVYGTNAGHFVQRHPTPFSVSVPTVDTRTEQPSNRPLHRPMNDPAHPPWLNAALNNFDPLIPVTVRPTEAEIDIATEEVRFGIVSSPVNSVCPITRERFGEDDGVMQIIHCGHNFNPPSLRYWFQTSVRCPLCRYDIREYDPTEAIRNPYRTPPHTETGDSTPNTGIDEHSAAEAPNSLVRPNRSETESFVPETPQQERTIQVNVSNRENVVSSIASYISQDIMAQLDNIPIDNSGNIMLEYSFRNHVTLPTDLQESHIDTSSNIG
jgi:hypothetical protein